MAIYRVCLHSGFATNRKVATPAGPRIASPRKHARHALTHFLSLPGQETLHVLADDRPDPSARLWLGEVDSNHRHGD